MFQAERNALVGLVDLEHLGLDLVALLQHFGRMIDLAGPGEVGDVDHAVDAFFELDEGAVGGEVADLALDAGAGRVLARHDFPRIGVELADAEETFWSSLLTPSDDRLDFLALVRTSAGRAIRLVHDSSETWTRPSMPGFQFHERAVGGRGWSPCP